jgi:beta-N-acetylhexosaminidase
MNTLALESPTAPMPPLSRRGLSLRERIGQTCQVHAGFMAGWSEGQVEDYFGCHPVGGIFIGGEVIGVSADTDKASALRDRIALFRRISMNTTGVPLAVAGDLENGAGGAVRGLTAFPNMMALGAAGDADAAYEYGRWTALEACATGFNWCLGPVADLSLNWLNPVVNLRSLGSDPRQVARLLDALIRGMQDHGLSATAKHFPGDGVDFRDQHLCLSINSLDETAWRRTFGAVFRRCIESGVHAIMAGHIALPWRDARTRDGCRDGMPIPATVSQPILTDLLRGELGFDGVLISDALIMAGFTGWADRERRLIEAFNAGIDVMLWPGDDYFDLIERALADGRISEKRLDESVARVLALKSRQADVAGNPADTSHCRPATQVGITATDAAAFARQLGQRSLTLLRNRASVLPLAPDRARRVCVVVASIRDDENALAIAEPLLARLRARGCEVTVQVNGNCLDLTRREEAGERFDALIALFEQSIHGQKNTMRPTAAPAECMWMLQGLATMRPVIVSLGSPYLLHDMPWADTCINAYGSSRFSLEALDAALFGEKPFTGSCPVDAGGEWLTPANRCSPIAPCP